MDRISIRLFVQSEAFYFRQRLGLRSSPEAGKNKLKPLRRAKGPFKRLDFLLTFLAMKKVRKIIGKEY